MNSVVVGGGRYEVCVCQGTSWANSSLKAGGAEVAGWASELKMMAMQISSSTPGSTGCVVVGDGDCEEIVICGEDAAFNGGGRGAGGRAFGRGGGTVVVVCVAPQLSFEDIEGVLAYTVLTRASALDDCAGVISVVEWSQGSRCAISSLIFSSGG